jgi:hypothetical protein
MQLRERTDTLRTIQVEVAVWDYDTWGDPDFLGTVTVPIAPLMENLHLAQNYAARLDEDFRYQADENSAIKISGTISFTLQITTEAVLAQLENLEKSEHKAGKDKTYFTAGDTFGEEQLLEIKGSAPNSIIVEQPTTVLRISGEDYKNEVLPLQADEDERKVQFFSELTIFRDSSREQLQEISRWFRTKHYKPGQVLSSQGLEPKEMIFIMKGQVSVVVDVPEMQRRAHRAAFVPGEAPLLHSR